MAALKHLEPDCASSPTHGGRETRRASAGPTFRRVCLAIMACITCLPATGAAADWFEPAAHALDGWSIAEDGPTIVVTPAGKTPEYEISVVWAKKSDAYDEAFGAVLVAFADAELRARWRIRLMDPEACAPPEAASCGTALRRAVGRPDLIMTLGTRAMRAAHSHLRTGEAPVVTVASKDPKLMQLSPPFQKGGPIAYTSLDSPAAALVEAMKLLLPEIGAVIVVSIASNDGARRTQVRPMLNELESRGSRSVDAGFTKGGDLGKRLRMDIAREAARLRTDGLDEKRALVWVTGCTALFDHIHDIRKGAGGLAVLGVTMSLVDGTDNGLAMAIGSTYEANGRLGADYAISILRGADPATMSVGVLEPPEVALDFKAMKAAGHRVPFELFERAAVIYDGEGHRVRQNGQPSTTTTREED